MKTSTTFACGIPETEKEFNLLIYSLLEHDKNFQKDYGLQKIFNPKLNEYIGVIGLIRREKFNDLSYIVEGVIFLKSNYLNSGSGYWALELLFSNLEELKGIMVASVWEHNRPSIRLIKANGMNFVKKASKAYKGRTIGLELYVKSSKDIIL